MNSFLLKLRARRLMKPAGDDGSDAGGTDTVDRGDDFVPTDDDAADTAAAAARAADAAAEEAEAEAALAAAAEKDKAAAKAKAKDEGEDPDDEDDEAKAAKAAGKEGKSGGMIPVSRHKAMLDKARQERDELAQQLTQFQKGQAVAALNTDLSKQETAILDMEKQYNSLLADGEIEKASVLMSKIRQAERAITEAQNDMKIAAAEARATERARFNIALERIEAAYPQLNEDHDDFDPELMIDVVDLKVTYERKGMTPTDAMQKAVKKLVGTETRKQEAAATVTPNVAPGDVAAERKKDAVAKTKDALNKTPPSTAKVGLDSDKAGGSLTAKDVMKLSQKDFAALPDDVLAKLRGDTV